MSRKTYTAEFKTEALRLMADRDLALAEVARRLGVSEGCMRSWRDAARRNGEAASPGRGRPSPADEELVRLRAENHRLRAERDLLKRAAADFASPPTYQFVADNRAEWPVAWMCDALEVSESGYHIWFGRDPSPADRRRGELTAVIAVIAVIHAEVHGRYGGPRVHAEPNARGVACCVNAVAKLVRANGIRAKSARRLVRTTDLRHGLPVAGNVLAQDFAPAAPDVAWAS